MKTLKTTVLAFALIAGLSSCGGADENDNGNSDETQLFCDCMNNPNESEECKELGDKMTSEFNAADEKGKAAMRQEWKEKQAMCK